MTPSPRPVTLGPKQIKWLRDNVPAFDPAWSSVKKADEYAEKIRARLIDKQEVAAP